MKRYRQSLSKAIICPHCFEPFVLWDIRFQDGTGNMYPPYRPSFARLRRLSPKFALGPSGERLRDKVCPNPKCKGRLPYTAGEQEDLIISLVGEEYSGKSLFVAMLLERLEGSVSTAFNASLLPVDDTTRIRRRQEYQEPLHRGLEVVETPPYSPPLLYNLAVTERGKHSGNRSVTLVLRDPSGVIFRTEDRIICQARELLWANSLLFLLDPGQMEVVRQSLSSAVKLPQFYARAAPQDILGRVVRVLQYHGLVDTFRRRQRKLTIPVAIVLTKCDILRDAGLIDPRCLWNQDIHHEGTYNLSLHNDMNDMFSELVKAWSAPVWAIIQTHFARVAFFGVTATGCSFDAQGRCPKIAPWRVEDPLLWLLYQLGVISGSEAP